MATPNYGTIDTLDTLAANLLPVAQIGEDRVWETIEAALAAHNAILREQLEQFVDFTTDQLLAYGGLEGMEMQELDQYGIPDAQSVITGDTMGFPLRLRGNALQWTRAAIQIMTGQEMARQVTALESADRRKISYDFKRALFIPTNYTFKDRLMNGVALPVKALVNADGAPIPLGPEGEEFDGATHNHYLASAVLDNAAVDNAVQTVTQHYGEGTVYIYINQGNEVAFTALTNFTEYPLLNIVAPITEERATGGVRTPFRMNNRAIGIYKTGSAEVWVKPWIPLGYIFVWVDGAPKPLVYRTRPNVPGAGELQLVIENDDYPLRARAYTREYGIAVRNRTNGAVLYIGGGTYVTPTIVP